MQVNIRPPSVPRELLAALEKWDGKYSIAREVFHLVSVGGYSVVGVFGDGSMGCYEWFVYDGQTLRTSDAGYGNDAGALRDVLNAEWPA